MRAQAALKVAAAGPSAPKACSDPSCSVDHSHAGHDHGHEHGHAGEKKCHKEDCHDHGHEHSHKKADEGHKVDEGQKADEGHMGHDHGHEYAHKTAEGPCSPAKKPRTD